MEDPYKLMDTMIETLNPETELAEILALQQKVQNTGYDLKTEQIRQAISRLESEIKSKNVDIVDHEFERKLGRLNGQKNGLELEIATLNEACRNLEAEINGLKKELDKYSKQGPETSEVSIILDLYRLCGVDFLESDKAIYRFLD